MNEKSYQPLAITRNFYRLGMPAFPVYLSLGDSGALIEGGTGGTADIIIRQIKELGVEPERIKYIILTHTHADHIGAVPRLKKIWPHLKVIASQIAADLLQSEEMLKGFVAMDRTLAEIMLAKGEIAELPPVLDNYAFSVDRVVKEGDKIDLGSGIVWAVYEAPGHSPCHIALFEETEKTLVTGDTTGFYVPDKDVFWPNYFQSLEAYCRSIRKLAALPARRAVLSHNYIVEDGLKSFFGKAMLATEAYHLEMVRRSGNGNDIEKVAQEKAEWVSTITDDQPLSIMYTLSKVLIKRSQSEAAKKDLFTFP